MLIEMRYLFVDLYVPWIFLPSALKWGNRKNTIGQTKCTRRLESFEASATELSLPLNLPRIEVGWLVVLEFNATLTAKVISWRSVPHMCFLAFSHQY